MKATKYHQSRHLGDSQLLQQTPECPLCGATDRRKSLSLQKQPDVDLMECLTCHGVSASRVPTEDALREYYSTYYSPDSEQKITFDGLTRLGQHIASIACPQEGLRVLDFGGGDGSIANSVLSASAICGSVTVVDHPSSASSTALKNVLFVTDLDGLEPTDKFDLVIASAVLEHLPRPIEVLRDLCERLEPDGILWGRTPYVVPLMKLAKKFG